MAVAEPRARTKSLPQLDRFLKRVMVQKSSSAERTTPLAFGIDSSLNLPFAGLGPDTDSDDEAVNRMIAFVGRPRGEVIDDPKQFLIESLADPIGFPPLVEATVPGDRVAIAVGRGIPQVAAIVAAVVETLASGRVEPADICVVLPNETDNDDTNDGGEHHSARFDDVSQDIVALLPSQVGKAVTFELHDSSDQSQLCYLAATSDAKPIFFNRTICEADLVIPVGCLRPTGTLGYIDDAMGLFPTFADDETIHHFCMPSSWVSPAQREKHHERAGEAAWLLGVTFTVQVLPGAGDQLLRILAGEREAVFARGRVDLQTAWKCSVPCRSSLVVAAIEGGADQQTWENIGYALNAALNVVEDDGAVVICSELATRPGVTLQKIRGVDPDSHAELYEIEQTLSKETHHDAVVATQLLAALGRVRVYLYSQLDEELVEELGIAPVSRIGEIANLCRRYPSCIALANAQRLVPIVDAEQQ